MVKWSQLAASAAALGLHRGGLDLDLPGGARRRGGPHPVLDLRRHGHEGLLHVRRVLGRRLQEGDAQLVGVLLKSTKNANFISRAKILETKFKNFIFLAYTNVLLDSPSFVFLDFRTLKKQNRE